jgi:signal transduction histidine kinase
MLARLRRRIEEKCQVRGLLYPWWVPVTCFVGQEVCVLLALGFRDELWPIGPLHLTLLLVAAAPVVQIGLGRWLPWYVDVLGSLLAATWLLAVPATPAVGPMDAAPALLMFSTAEATARDGIREGAVVGAVSTLLIGVAGAQWGLTGAGVHVLTVLLGYVVGAMLLWQMRALAAERAAREQAWQQATLAERQRIAREIHDLVAHSLSVTLLHLTGARHALRDLRDGDPADAADTAEEVDGALADAEQIGRQAMTDIRRTVGTLADGPAPARALPGAESIGGLVRQMADAGLAVEYGESGDPATLPATTGLGLFRIAQESLANVAKHAPTATAHVRLEVTDRGARLVVRNELVGSDALLRRRPRGDGSGLAGIQARAQQMHATLTAGPEGDAWVVDIRVPAPRRAREVAAPAVPGVAR